MGSGVPLPKQVPNDGRVIGIPVNGNPSLATPTLQFNSVTNEFDWVAGGGGVSGDLAFLSKKEFDGNIVRGEGTLSVVGDLVSITAAVGKDLYSAKSKMVMYMIGAEVSFGVKISVELLINAVLVETGKISQIGNTATAAGVQSANYQFVSMGQKAAPTEIIKLEAVVVSSNHDVTGSLVCFIVDTGTDPTA